jgi:hypothetical protein
MYFDFRDLFVSKGQLNKLFTKLSLPFKGRVGVGMGNQAERTPIPHLSSPLKGKGRHGKLFGKC